MKKNITTKRYMVLAAALIIPLLGVTDVHSKSWWKKLKKTVVSTANTTVKQVESTAGKAVDGTNMALNETENLANDVADYAEGIARAELDKLLNTVFADLKKANLDQLTNVAKVGDADFWMDTVVNGLAKEITGIDLVQKTKEVADNVKSGIGTPSETYPFGNGVYGKLVLEQTKYALDEALGAGKGLLSSTNPLKNPVNTSPDDARIFANYFPFDLPKPLVFKYEIALQVKPIEIKAPIKFNGIPIADGVTNVAFKMPLISGDWENESSAFDNILKKKKLNFQVSLALAVVNTQENQKLTGSKNKIEEQLAFDITCSTESIGQCQLKKIGLKTKFEMKHEATSNSNFALALKTALGGMINVMRNPLATTVFFGGNKSAKQEYLSALSEIKNMVDTAYQVTKLVEPPTRQAATLGFTLMDEFGFYKPLAGFMAAEDAITSSMKEVTPFLDALYSYSKLDGSKVVDSVTGTRKSSYSESVSKDFGVTFHFLNDDMMNGIFKAGWTPTERTKSDGLAQTVSLEIGAGGSADAKIEFGDTVSASMTLDSKASFGVVFPLHKQASRYLKNQTTDRASVTTAETQAAKLTAGNDPYNLGASKNWGSLLDDDSFAGALTQATEQDELMHESSELANRTDVLTLPAFMAAISE